ncbi:hypothetical protein PHMEG_00024682 [Phytophthora megakarya]|uniref:Uncharacterized protein n=1 Tax=Phytophthora megakarya TaxID=4795 RepID=A0A225VDW4_9STRA|nr:hypothetical protein PHMEG_00024682 [Phytophthora megakarya]
MSTFIEHLKTVVDQGDYGEKSYPLAKIKARLEFSKDRYVFGAFSWKRVMETQAPVLLFVGACNAVAGVRGHARIPDDPQHILGNLHGDSVLSVISEGVNEASKAGLFTPDGQLSVQLPSYFSRLRFPQQEAYVWKTEYWLQAGNRESPVHVDHGRVVSYLPPSARHCFKIWVGVMTQRPGDVICLNNLVLHSVLLVYNKNTAPEDKWGGIFGDIIVCAEDRLDSFRYGTKVPSGSKKASREAWESLLSAYSVMETGDYDPANYEEEKKKILEKLSLPPKSEMARIGANAKRDKKRKMGERMMAVRAGKKGKEGESIS